MNVFAYFRDDVLSALEGLVPAALDLSRIAVLVEGVEPLRDDEDLPADFTL